MIYLRDDDILVPSGNYSDAVKRFKSIHGWTVRTPNMLHVGAILVNSLQKFPEGIEFIKEQTALGNFHPEIHGIDHIDFAKKTKKYILKDLKQCRSYIQNTFNFNPTKWFTPWGAMNPTIQEAAEELGIKAIGVQHDLNIPMVTKALRIGKISISTLEEQYVLAHWWEKGNRVARLCLAIQYGSWQAAAKAEPELF